ncbi:phage head morphogenesis protein [Pseudomonas sp. HK3]
MHDLIPKEALAWFSDKSLQVGFDHNDVWQQEHSRAFTVAKAMQVDVLSDIRDAVQGALKEGKTFNQFRAELTPTLQNKGWWGQQEMTDPHDGRLKEVQLGSARRLRTIYRTNMRTARAAGQWDRIQRTLKTHPYLQYNLGPSEHHRTEHEFWNKLVLPANDAWWQTHFAPNGWGCKCRIRQISTAEAKRLGINTAPPIQNQEWVNKRTGEVHNVPKGIDPGWAYNPGTSRNQPIVHFVDKLEVVQPELSAAAVDKLVKSDVFNQWHQNPQGEFPVGVLNTDIKERLKATQSVVKLDDKTLTKQLKTYSELTLSEYQLLPKIMGTGRVIVNGKKILIYGQHNVRLYKLLVAKHRSGKLYLEVFYRAKEREMRSDLRKGKLIRG